MRGGNDELEAEVHRGRSFRAAGVGSFVRDGGEGDPVVLMHGLPSSSFLYRKVIAHLTGHGLRGIAFDLPGLGLAERPRDFDYTFAGLGRWSAAAVDELGLDRFHLVVHDAGGPVGFEMAGSMRGRIRSLTLLNTAVSLDRVPFPMEVYARYALGRGWPALPGPRVFRRAFRAIALGDQSRMTDAEVDVYRELVLREDNGAAYLQIMQNLRRSEHDYTPVVDSRTTPYPVQVLWGARDPALRLGRFGWRAREATGVATVQTVPGRHFPQEDFAPEIADAVAALARTVDG